MEIPQTRYARTVDDVHIAYQVFGEGPVDMVFAFGEMTNADLMWDMPELANFVRRLGAFSRVIYFDGRGNGLSDRNLGSASFEAGMDDIRAVMDAAGSQRALQFGFQDGGMLSVLFAASFPDRASGLILANASVRGLWAPDYPGGWTEEQWDEYLAQVGEGWGTLAHAEEQLRILAPSHPSDTSTIERFARYFRASASPGSMMALDRMIRDSDVRPVLPTIQVPTLVMHTIENQMEPVEQARYIAERINGATLVELPSDEHLLVWETADAVIDNVERFARQIRDDEADFDRVLATVLFTDIVGLHRPERRDGRSGVDGGARAARPGRAIEPRSVPGTGDQDDGRRVPRNVRRARTRGPLRRIDRVGGQAARHRDSRGVAHWRSRARRR